MTFFSLWWVQIVVVQVNHSLHTYPCALCNPSPFHATAIRIIKLCYLYSFGNALPRRLRATRQREIRTASGTRRCFALEAPWWIALSCSSSTAGVVNYPRPRDEFEAELLAHHFIGRTTQSRYMCSGRPLGLIRPNHYA